MPVDVFRKQVDVILGGTFIVTKAVATAMVEVGNSRLDHQRAVDGGLAG